MKLFWIMAAAASGLAFSSPALARPSSASCAAAANGGRTCAAPTTARPADRSMSGTGKTLCAVLLGCMLVTGNLAARRRAPRVVFS